MDIFEEIPEKCPNCRNELTTTHSLEEISVQLWCECCDYSALTKSAFCIPIWNIVLYEKILLEVDIFKEVFTNEDIASLPLNRHYDADFFYDEEDRTNNDLRNKLFYSKQELFLAYSTYLDQTITIIVTYLEMIIKHFYIRLFVKKPQRMYSYLSIEEVKKGYVKLEEIVSVETHEQLIENLATKSAEIASKAPLHKIIEKLVKETGLNRESIFRDSLKDFIKDLEKLNSERNILVHEARSKGYSEDEVYNSLGMLYYLLFFLAHVSKKLGLPVLDDENYLQQWEEKLRLNEDQYFKYRCLLPDPVNTSQ